MKTRNIKRWLTGGLVLAAANVPSAAQARYTVDAPAAPAASVPAQREIASAQPSGTSAQPSATSAQPTGTSARPGFQWGDAGIGAAGTVAFVGAGVAASGLARRRRSMAG
jgi:hypothetical protein